MAVAAAAAAAVAMAMAASAAATEGAAASADYGGVFGPRAFLSGLRVIPAKAGTHDKPHARTLPWMVAAAAMTQLEHGGSQEASLWTAGFQPAFFTIDQSKTRVGSPRSIDKPMPFNLLHHLHNLDRLQAHAGDARTLWSLNREVLNFSRFVESLGVFSLCRGRYLFRRRGV